MPSVRLITCVTCSKTPRSRFAARRAEFPARHLVAPNVTQPATGTLALTALLERRFRWLLLLLLLLLLVLLLLLTLLLLLLL